MRLPKTAIQGTAITEQLQSQQVQGHGATSSQHCWKNSTTEHEGITVIQTENQL